LILEDIKLYNVLDFARETSWLQASFVDICLVKIRMASERIMEIWQDSPVDY